jgi:SAM-dependent methyltransferase
MSNDGALKDAVRENYARAALRVSREQTSTRSGCCGGEPSTARAPSACCGDPISSNLYPTDESSGLPAGALAASLGCGNPTALAELSPGETVLDLGSGGGIDVLLAARRVGAEGKAYGLDMTDEMLELARANQRAEGVENAEFLKGDIDHIPLPDHSVDVIISNCVINLAGDKDRLIREAFRVLRPGGRFAVSDIVVSGAVPAVIRDSVESWIGCIAGALAESEYERKLAAAGFERVGVEPTRIYTAADAAVFLKHANLDEVEIAQMIDGKFMSAFVRGSKPA